MSTISAALGESSGPHVFRHGGKEYLVSRLTQEKKAEYERLMQGRAIGAVVSARKNGVLTEDEFRDAYDAALERVASGAFAFHSPFTQRALQTPGGVVSLTAVLFGAPEEEVRDLLRARPDDVRAALDVVLKESAANPPAAA